MCNLDAKTLSTWHSKEPYISHCKIVILAKNRRKLLKSRRMMLIKRNVQVFGIAKSGMAFCNVKR